MRIKKIKQTTQTNATIINDYDTSTTDGYSCDYVNNKIEYFADKIIVETGSNANGNWIKYGDGTMIVTQQYTTTIAQNGWSTWGSMYAANLSDPPPYPIAFLNGTIPNVSVTTSHDGANFWLYDRGAGGSKDYSPYMGVVRPNAAGGNSIIRVYVIAIGRWK